MGKAGLRVFFDEYSINAWKGITNELQLGISSSKLFVAYYSKDFSSRDACQRELSAAYIAAQQTGNSERFVIVNPEKSEDHIFPRRLRREEYVISQTTTPETTARAIGKRAASLSNKIGEVPHNYHPHWYGPRKFWQHYITRYPKLWDIHTSLTDGSGDPNVLVTGERGAGKTSTVNRYIHYFGAAFSNVYWQQYDHPDELTDSEKMSTINHILRPNLRVIDNIPSDVSLEDLWGLFPASSNTYNILIGTNPQFQDLLATITIDDLSTEEAQALISRYREPGSKKESVELARLVGRIGGNASDVHRVALQLENMQGFISYSDI